MTRGVDQTVNQHIMKNLGVLNQDYVVFEQLGPDGRIHRNFVTLDQPQLMKHDISQSLFK